MDPILRLFIEGLIVVAYSVMLTRAYIASNRRNEEAREEERAAFQTAIETLRTQHQTAIETLREQFREAAKGYEKTIERIANERQQFLRDTTAQLLETQRESVKQMADLTSTVSDLAEVVNAKNDIARFLEELRARHDATTR